MIFVMYVTFIRSLIKSIKVFLTLSKNYTYLSINKLKPAFYDTEKNKQ